MKRAALLMLCLLVLGHAPPLLAAEPEPAEPAAEEDAAGATETDPELSVDEALAEEIRAAEEAAANAAPVDRNEPFVPTVQISEDLSVSFPADI